MIKGIQSTGLHVVTSNNPGSIPYIQPKTDHPSIGQMRCIQGHIEIFDGANWIRAYLGESTVSLGEDAQNAIKWSLRKMQEEKELQDRLEKHPGLKDAYEKFQVLDALTKDNDSKQN